MAGARPRPKTSKNRPYPVKPFKSDIPRLSRQLRAKLNKPTLKCEAQWRRILGLCASPMGTPLPEDALGNVDAAVFRVVRAGNAYEETVERLLQVIKLGIVPHGERLPPERELASRLGVSRVTLREAIRSLQQAGYVEPRRGRFGGTFVLYQPNPSNAEARRIAGVLGGSLEDALTFRRVLEPGVAEVVAQRELSELQQSRLRESLSEVESAAHDDLPPGRRSPPPNDCRANWFPDGDACSCGGAHGPERPAGRHPSA